MTKEELLQKKREIEQQIREKEQEAILRQEEIIEMAREAHGEEREKILNIILGGEEGFSEWLKAILEGHDDDEIEELYEQLTE